MPPSSGSAPRKLPPEMTATARMPTPLSTSPFTICPSPGTTAEQIAGTGCSPPSPCFTSALLISPRLWGETPGPAPAFSELVVGRQQEEHVVRRDRAAIDRALHVEVGVVRIGERLDRIRLGPLRD